MIHGTGIISIYHYLLTSSMAALTASFTAWLKPPPRDMLLYVCGEKMAMKVFIVIL